MKVIEEEKINQRLKKRKIIKREANTKKKEKILKMKKEKKKKMK